MRFCRRELWELLAYKLIMRVFLEEDPRTAVSKTRSRNTERERNRTLSIDYILEKKKLVSALSSARRDCSIKSKYCPLITFSNHSEVSAFIIGAGGIAIIKLFISHRRTTVFLLVTRRYVIANTRRSESQTRALALTVNSWRIALIFCFR